MSDPLASLLNQDSNPYDTSPSAGILRQLFETVPPPVLAEAAGTLLKRIAVLEMYLEDEMNFEVKENDLKSFLEKNHPEVDKEVERLASYFFGSISRREGG